MQLFSTAYSFLKHTFNVERINMRLCREGFKIYPSKNVTKVYYQKNFIGRIITSFGNHFGAIDYIDVKPDEENLDERHEGREKLTSILREFDWKVCEVK